MAIQNTTTQNSTAAATKAEFNGLVQGNGDAMGQLSNVMAGAVVQSYDNQIQSFTAELEANNALKEQLQNTKTQVSSLLSKTVTITNGDVTSTTDTTEKYEFTIDGTSSSFTGEAVIMNQNSLNALKEKAAQCGMAINVDELPKCDNKYAVPTGLINDIKEAFDKKVQDLNSNSEIKMINYQSLMDARKQAMMMLSNMLNSANQTVMSIIQNMKS